jgi:hypothetical protein
MASVKKKSTLTNLMTFYSDLLHSVSIQDDAVYTDMKKEFDTVNIDILINKLNVISVRDPILSWFKKLYLSDRIQQVKIGSSISKNINVFSRVSHGGHLSPLLFIIFINYINNLFPHYNSLYLQTI